MNLFASKTFSVGLAALACLLAAPARAGITYEMVTVGNAGNAGDSGGTGNGAVAYDYQIGKYDVTIGQYTTFLNAVATTDTNSLWRSTMANEEAIAGISRSGVSGAYSYSVLNNGGDSSNRPITYVSWFDAARFTNWMANGQPTGAQDSSTTENGAYNVAGATDGFAPLRNATNPNTGAAPSFHIATNDEWYKSAYYSPVLNSGAGGYWDYATQSDTAPGNIIGSEGNQANYKAGGVYSVTQIGDFDPFYQNYLTDVGAFTSSASYYGTFDQSGNVANWLEVEFRGFNPNANFRGGEWDVSDPSRLRSLGTAPTYYEGYNGFRLASSVASGVPEIDPSSFGSALALVLGSLGLFERRRAR